MLAFLIEEKFTNKLKVTVKKLWIENGYLGRTWSYDGEKIEIDSWFTALIALGSVVS